MKRRHTLGVFVSPDAVCPGGICPEGWELYCFRAGRNPRACVVRLIKKVAKYYRKPGECTYILRDPRTGKVAACTAGQVKKGEPSICRLGERVAKLCPPQRRKRGYNPGIVGREIRPIRRA